MTGSSIISSHLVQVFQLAKLLCLLLSNSSFLGYFDYVISGWWKIGSSICLWLTHTMWLAVWYFDLVLFCNANEKSNVHLILVHNYGVCFSNCNKCCFFCSCRFWGYPIWSEFGNLILPPYCCTMVIRPAMPLGLFESFGLLAAVQGKAVLPFT